MTTDLPKRRVLLVFDVLNMDDEESLGGGFEPDDVINVELGDFGLAGSFVASTVVDPEDSLIDPRLMLVHVRKAVEALRAAEDSVMVRHLKGSVWSALSALGPLLRQGPAVDQQTAVECAPASIRECTISSYFEELPIAVRLVIREADMALTLAAGREHQNG